MNCEKVVSILKTKRFSVSNEKALQREIESVFTNLKIPFRREVRLSEQDIIDFTVAQIGIEVKINGNKRSIYRQLSRYAEYEQVTSLILATNKAIGMPDSINNKPIYVLNISKSWL